MIVWKYIFYLLILKLLIKWLNLVYNAIKIFQVKAAKMLILIFVNYILKFSITDHIKCCYVITVKEGEFGALKKWNFVKKSRLG